MPDEVLCPVKVAFRTEGDFVVAYVADTQGLWKVEMGRILRRICDDRKDVWEEFKGVMRKAGFFIIEEVLGEKVVSSEELPPEMLEGGGPEV